MDSEADKMKRSRAQVIGSPSVDLLTLADYVEQFTSKRVILLGDFVADEFQFGEISRVSREAPVLILRHRETQLVPGGGANAANNLEAWAAAVLATPVAAPDVAGGALVEYFRQKKVDSSRILQVKNW